MKVWYDRAAGAFYLSRAAVPAQFMAQAGRVIELVPSATTLATQAMADCMDMVRGELVEAGIIGQGVAPMFVADAVCAYIRNAGGADPLPILRDMIALRHGTQAAAARHWNVSPAFVSMVMTGSKAPTEQMLTEAGLHRVAVYRWT